MRVFLAISAVAVAVLLSACSATQENGNGSNEGVLENGVTLAPPTITRTSVYASNEMELRGALVNADSTPTRIVLTADIEMESNFIIHSGADVALTSQGTNMFSLITTRDIDVITVSGNASLTIEGIGVTRVYGTRGSGVRVNRDGALMMTGGVITGNTGNSGGGRYSHDSGGGVFVYRSTFTMYGGEISNNEVYRNGGGVYVQRGTFTMYGGTISSNSANHGSFARAGGGGINGGGGGVALQWYGSFTMYGGEISNNYARGLGGGVLVGASPDSNRYISTFTMRGGIISNNTVDRNPGWWPFTQNPGGGIYLSSSSCIFVMEGGWIYDNFAESFESRGGHGWGVPLYAYVLDSWIDDIAVEDGVFNNNIFNPADGAIGSPPPQ